MEPIMRPSMESIVSQQSIENKGTKEPMPQMLPVAGDLPQTSGSKITKDALMHNREQLRHQNLPPALKHLVNNQKESSKETGLIAAVEMMQLKYPQFNNFISALMRSLG